MTDGRRDDGGAAPTNPPIPRYGAEATMSPADARLYSEVSARNGPPLIAALAPWLAGRGGTVLEIGCGTGQHGAAFELAFPDLNWLCSDLDPGHRASAAAWRAHLRLRPLEPLAIDAATAWTARVAAHTPLAAVFSANVIHIAPQAVLNGILREAPGVLGRGGLLIFYGPFKEAGRHTGPGNETFDAQLRAQNPDWGLRNLDTIRDEAADRGFDFVALRAMPANNRLAIFKKS